MIEAGSCRAFVSNAEALHRMEPWGHVRHGRARSLERESGARTSQTPYNARNCSTSHQGLLRPRGVDLWCYCASVRGMRVIVDQRNHAILAFDQRRAAFNPITAVVIRNRAEFADRCAVDVATQYGINVVPFRVMSHSGFEFADEAHSVLHSSLGIRTQRPIAQTETPPHKVN